MILRVGDILKLPSFSKMKLIAGFNGTNNIVKSVNIFDAPDIESWLKGGEILITNGYIVKDDPMKFIDIIRKIERAGAAALAIKLKRFIDELPEEVIKLADKLAFPIISFPADCPYVDIINPVLTEIVNQQARKLLYSEKIHKSFTDLVLKGDFLFREQNLPP